MMNKVVMNEKELNNVAGGCEECGKYNLPVCPWNEETTTTEDGFTVYQYYRPEEHFNGDDSRTITVISKEF